MADYKKKHVNHLYSPKKVKKSRVQNHSISNVLTEEQDIKMRPSATYNKTVKISSPEVKVVKGKKLEQRRKFKVLVSVVTIVAAIALFFQLLLPIGIVESVGNILQVMGSGSYPVELDSTESMNCVSKGQYYYLLTDTRINAFSTSGKNIFSIAHGLEHPALKTSSTRCLVYDQGGDTVLIYNLSKEKLNFNSKSKILTANIARNGNYVLVTESDSYASEVSVYDKNSNLLYKWFSSKDIVNNVVISPNGKKIAVSTLNAEGGKYKSQIYVLEYNSATPVYSLSYDDTVIYSIDSTDNKGFSVITDHKYEFINWSKYKKSEYEDDYFVSLFKSSSGGNVIVFNRESDRTDNHIAVMDNYGQLKYKFSYNGLLSDIAISDGHIYCISDNEVCIFDKSGNQLRHANCGYGGTELAVLSTYSVAVITDSQINKIVLEE